MNETITEQYTPLNIRELACRVSPILGRLIPNFTYRYFEKILHIEELNSFFSAHFNDSAQDFLDATVNYLNIKVQFEGCFDKVKNLSGQSVMAVSNHPYGGPEALVLFDEIHKLFPDSKLLTQSFLKIVKPLQTCCVFNKKDIQTLINAVNNNISLLFYPAGYCSRELSFGEVFDFDWKKSFVKIAKKNNMPILVFYTDGQMSRRMHRWYKFRKFFHIESSIETLFLVDEMFMLRGKTLKIVAGDIIYPNTLTNNVSDTEWALRLRQYCYYLKNNYFQKFNPEEKAVLPIE